MCNQIDMIAQVWENKEFGKKFTKKNSWENFKMAIEMKNKNQFPKTLFFFDFFNTLKQIKIDLYNLKILWKFVAKILGKIEKFALENSWWIN